MSDDPYQPLGSMDGFFIVVNQIKAHYLAAGSLLAGRLNRPEARFWVFPKVLDSCSECIENIVDRVALQRGIERRDHEEKRKYRKRVCKEAGLVIGRRALAHLKTLTDIWNDNKHSGDGEAWKRTVNRSTLGFTMDSFDLTTAFVVAYYRWLGSGEQPVWVRRADIQDGEVLLSPLTACEMDNLLSAWGVSLSNGEGPSQESSR